ncbi:acyl carrier protein [Methylomonas rosea]|uniref:acyl carrier protein n=1 Tax=Methylomonas rosea TaxID=2952227 RepID=UPI003531CACD
MYDNNTELLSMVNMDKRLFIKLLLSLFIPTNISGIFAKVAHASLKETDTTIVTELCQSCIYTDCVDVCPTDAFHQGETMLYINPTECIDCTLCIYECPVGAIYNGEYLINAKGLDYATKWARINKAQAEKFPVISAVKELGRYDSNQCKDLTASYKNETKKSDLKIQDIIQKKEIKNDDCKNIESRVKNITAEQLGVKERIYSESKIVEDLGADEYDQIELVMAIEEDFHIRVKDEDSEKIKTVKDVIAIVNSNCNR